jgi:putative phosphoesterase
MLIGILSDTHDRYEIMGDAVRALQARGARFFIHCGDVCTPHLLDHLAGLPSAFVWGNCDWDRLALQRYADSIAVPCYGMMASLDLGGKQVAVLHGDDRQRMEAVLRAQKHDYLLHGHTHVRRDERVGKTRIINPGALFRAAEKTVALLDTDADVLEYLRIPVEA